MPPRDQLSPASLSDLVCFSHLRWRWVYQRPQHLMTRAARDRRVFYVEEPIIAPGAAMMTRESVDERVTVIRPHMPCDASHPEFIEYQRQLLDAWMDEDGISPDVLWYYTPQALPFSSHLRARLTVYDCMDELSGFAGAPPELKLRERQLLAQSDVVFTGGFSLYEVKRTLHPHVHPMPSSVDAAHFRQARLTKSEPADQAQIPSPRIGFCGVLDERLDLDLIEDVAAARRDWQFVFVGPVTKIPMDALPTGDNLHYLGARDYDDLPGYLGGWDVAMLPFAHNKATQFISPTKTPEYLAAGRQVVSTSIRDVVRSWGNSGLVRFADTRQQFVEAIDACLHDKDASRLARIDRALAEDSWDHTWHRMHDIMSSLAVRVA